MKKNILRLTLSLSLLINGYLILSNKESEIVPYTVTHIVYENDPYLVLNSDIFLNAQMKTDEIEKYLISKNNHSSRYNLPVGEYYLLKRDRKVAQESYYVIKVKVLEKTQ